MTRGSRRRSGLQQELLRLIRPYSRRLAQQPSEQLRPTLSEVARQYAGHPAAEAAAALEAVIRAAGMTPDRTALAELAEEIEDGQDPFA